MAEQSHVQWSVVIPAYMPGDNLTIAVASVLTAMGARRDFEIVVVDDASPTPVQLTIQDDRVRLARMADNVGAVPNFNRSLAQASGEFIHILHADDYVEPGFYTALEQGLSIEGVVAAACGVNRVDGDGTLIEVQKPEQSQAGIWPDAFDRLAVANRLPAVSIVAPRSTYEVVGDFDESLVHAADWDLWIRFAQAGAFYYDPAPLATYRVHDAQHTAAVSSSGTNIDEAITVIKRLPARVDAPDATTLMTNAFLYRAVYAARTAKRAVLQRRWPVAALQLKAAARCGLLGATTAARGLVDRVRT